MSKIGDFKFTTTLREKKLISEILKDYRSAKNNSSGNIRIFVRDTGKDEFILEARFDDIEDLIVYSDIIFNISSAQRNAHSQE